MEKVSRRGQGGSTSGLRICRGLIMGEGEKRKANGRDERGKSVRGGEGGVRIGGPLDHMTREGRCAENKEGKFGFWRGRLVRYFRPTKFLKGGREKGLRGEETRGWNQTQP